MSSQQNSQNYRSTGSYFSPFRYQNIKINTEFTPIFIKELENSVFNIKKYIRLVGIILNIKKKQKYVEYTINDSSGTIRVIFWFDQNIINEVNLIGSIARDNPALGTLVDIRGTIDKYNNKIQVKCFLLRVVDDPNFESFWWIKLYESRNRYLSRLTTQIQTSNIEINQYTPLRHKLCTINEDSSNNNLLNSRNVEIFKCTCKCHSNSSNNFSLSNSIQYKIISRQVAYSLRKLVMGNLVSYSDSPSKQQIHFAINKMLNCICNKNHILSNIPVSLFLCKY
ncbi:OB-fold nucleic acid binding domain-containing protein [Cryptosporidium muris RN66]|uniref:CST complex subunit STN1 n=1 Tax=Cryptosporidium muris (strain RN66) TaxID=441375 RepID=B6AH60_CRYMR|nr:OB-fold nucleic acid binding domain-containing protein [Cryptosporidium muris RN66]EEA07551.1 OB-fold nucleic acid binding domain-containing protein [Cryptosporidium muris RN66]|eukprot:XP_002141900.1 OB-fold nucleic acid binding domain-containing protein [Cryptosporidium muris RN66]